MNLFQKYGIKEVADVTFYSINTIGDEEIYTPVLFLDTLKVSTIEKSAEKVVAEGGKGNKKLITWNFGKEITLNLEDALFTPASMSLIWGGQLESKLSPYTSAIAKTNIANKYGILNYSTKAYPSPALTGEEWEIVFKAATELDLGLDGTAPTKLIKEINNNPDREYFLVPYATGKTEITSNDDTNTINVQLGWLLLYQDLDKQYAIPPTVRGNRLVVDSTGSTAIVDVYEGYQIYNSNLWTQINEIPQILKAQETALEVTEVSRDQIVNYLDAYNDEETSSEEKNTIIATLSQIDAVENNTSSAPIINAGKVASELIADFETFLTGSYSFYQRKNPSESQSSYHTFESLEIDGLNGSSWGFPPGYAMGSFSNYLNGTIPGVSDRTLQSVFSHFKSAAGDVVFWIGDVMPRQGDTISYRSSADSEPLTCTVNYVNETIADEVKPSIITDEDAILEKLGNFKNIYWIPNYTKTKDTELIEEHRTELRKTYFYRTFNIEETKAMPQEVINKIITYIDELKKIGSIETTIQDTEVIDRMEKCIVTNRNGLKISTKEQRQNLLRYYSGDETSSYIIYYDAKTMLPLFNISEDGRIQGWDYYDEEGNVTTPPYDRNFDGVGDLDTFTLKMGTVYYKWTRTVKYKTGADDGVLGRTFVIDAETFPDNYKIVGETYIRQQKTGKDERYQFIIHRAAVSSDTSITLEAEGDPTTFSMSVDVLSPPNDIMMELKQFDVDEDKLHGGTRIVPQKSRYSYTATNIENENTSAVDNPEMY